MEKDNIPQYLRIAISLGSDIAKGKYAVGTKMPGLSKLASQYGVSSETARKAMQMLSDLNIISMKEKKCAVVLSDERARVYLQSLEIRKERHELRDRMQTLFKNYQAIGRELEEMSSQVLLALTYPMPSEQMIPTFEVIVRNDTDKIGRSIGSLRIWQATGSTVIAIRRGQNTIVSPGPYEILSEGDILVCVGRPGCDGMMDFYINAPAGNMPPEEDTYHALWAENINEEILVERETIQKNICSCLGCRPEEILDITAMKEGLNNHSFSFVCRDRKYIYRHPGIQSGGVVNRKKEAAALNMAKRLGVDDTLLYVDEESGWKLSRYVTATEKFDFANKRHVAMLARQIKKLNVSGETLGYVFDYETEADKLIEMIRGINKSKYRNLLALRIRFRSVFDRLRKDAWPVGICHNDIYEPNLLIEGDELNIIDWEFAGDSDIGYDICKVFAPVTPEYGDLDEWLSLYYEEEVGAKEKLHLIGCAAVIYYYWYIWGLYADEIGENVREYLVLWYSRMNYYLGMLNEHKEDQ